MDTPQTAPKQTEPDQPTKHESPASHWLEVIIKLVETPGYTLPLAVTGWTAISIYNSLDSSNSFYEALHGVSPNITSVILLVTLFCTFKTFFQAITFLAKNVRLRLQAGPDFWIKYYDGLFGIGAPCFFVVWLMANYLAIKSIDKTTSSYHAITSIATVLLCICGFTFALGVIAAVGQSLVSFIGNFFHKQSK